VALLYIALVSCSSTIAEKTQQKQTSPESTLGSEHSIQIAEEQLNYGDRLAQAAIALTEDEVRYDPSYFSISYPGGDVPAHLGVCTDVVIRAYRSPGHDLQEAVHVDMKSHFAVYPKIWGLKGTDTNIDHRRVPNLMTFMERQGAELPMSLEAKDYLPGDVVCWNLGGAITHIGIVIAEAGRTGNPLIVHNIGSGQVKQDCLFSYQMIGHYRYIPSGE